MTPSLEILRNGSLRLKSGDCVFLLTRLRPSVMHTRIVGHDSGEFGTAPLEVMEAEITRFGEPLTWFVDAGDATGPPVAVSQAWTIWFLTHQKSLRAVHVLVSSRTLGLTVAIVRHLSRTGGLITIHEERASFGEAMRQMLPDIAERLPAPGDEDAQPSQILREASPDGSLRLTGEGATLFFLRLRPDVILTTVTGTDNGQFGDLPLDYMEAEIRNARAPLTWFIRAKEEAQASGRVSESWTTWMLAHSASLRRVVTLVESGFFHFQLNLLRRVADAERLMLVHTDPRPFWDAVEREAPGSRARLTEHAPL